MGKYGKSNRIPNLLLVTVLCIVSLISCAKQPKVSENKVHLTFSTFLAEEVFNSQIKQPVEAKFPDIELNYNWEFSAITQGLTNAKEIGDIRHVMVRSLMYDIDTTPELERAGILPAEDLTPYIEQSHFDASRIDRQIWNHAESMQTHGELAVLPYSKKLFALYYNKQVFDRYGVEYPRDGMTWDEVLALARQLPPGVKLDLSAMSWINLAYQIGIDWSDLGNPQETRDKWKKVISLYEDVASLPGYRYWEYRHDKSTEYLDDFKQKEVAMSISSCWYLSCGTNQISRSFALQDAIQAGIDMDVVTFPVFSAYKDQQPVRIEQALQMNANGLHKEEAFRVMTYLLSDEHQLSISKQGVGPVLDSPGIKQSFAAAVPEVQDRNVKAYFPQSRTGSLKKGRLLEAQEINNRLYAISIVFSEILQHKMDAESAIEQIMGNY